jgi:hypothetical protein
MIAFVLREDLSSDLIVRQGNGEDKEGKMEKQVKL